ncbi:hypothetical protein HPB52_003486 [Rhipicephalus sanguineus]|uniref:Uncharacterized protein n=1 Tax=Rhipicephalus sanguineus TaxID=34632 RepID=A0A9D4QBV7_RHISA|nr:hypothetical protein HPB52_003486 [Rhipicephalus sanguineus]
MAGLERFKKRHGMTSKPIIDETAAVNCDTADVRRQHWLQALLKKYKDQDICNIDEAAFSLHNPTKSLFHYH